MEFSGYIYFSSDDTAGRHSCQRAELWKNQKPYESSEKYQRRFSDAYEKKCNERFFFLRVYLPNIKSIWFCLLFTFSHVATIKCKYHGFFIFAMKMWTEDESNIRQTIFSRQFPSLTEKRRRRMKHVVTRLDCATRQLNT